MSAVQLVISGQDNAWRDIFGVSPIESRLSAALSAAGYTVTALTVDEGSALLSNALPYVATLTIATGIMPADPASVNATVSSAVTTATGYAPTSIANLTAGDPRPPGLPKNPVDAFAELVQKIADLLNVTADVAKILLVVGAIGAAVLIYKVAKNPERGARLARSVR